MKIYFENDGIILSVDSTVFNRPLFDGIILDASSTIMSHNTIIKTVNGVVHEYNWSVKGNKIICHGKGEWCNETLEYDIEGYTHYATSLKYSGFWHMRPNIQVLVSNEKLNAIVGLTKWNFKKWKSRVRVIQYLNCCKGMDMTFVNSKNECFSPYKSLLVQHSRKHHWVFKDGEYRNNPVVCGFAPDWIPDFFYVDRLCRSSVDTDHETITRFHQDNATCGIWGSIEEPEFMKIIDKLMKNKSERKKSANPGFRSGGKIMSKKDIMEAEEFRQAMVEADMMEAEINAESDMMEAENAVSDQEILDDIAKWKADQDHRDECDYWDSAIPEWM